MTPLRYCVAVLLVLLLPVSAAFAGGFQLNEHGTKAMAMGGAFAAQANDPSAIYFNPAGLAFQNGFHVLAGGTLIAPFSTWTSPTGATETEQVRQVFFPPNAYVTYGMKNGLAFGVGVFSGYGLGTEWPNPWAGDQLAIKTNLTSFNINPTVSYAYKDMISVGVGASYVTSEVKLTRALVVPIGGGRTLKGSTYLSGTKGAWGFSGGLLVKPIKNLSIGASYRSSIKLDYDGTATFTFPVPQVQALFPGGSGKTTIKLPDNIFAGIAYEFNPRFTLEGDFQYIGWSSYDQLSVTLAQGSVPASVPLTQTSVKDWKNTWMARVGAEYRFEPVALRFGFIYDKTPQPNKSVEPMLPDANRVEGTVGIGTKIVEHLTLDFAFQFIMFSDRTVTSPENVFPGTYTNKAYLFGLDIGYNL
jgi:long-chain fatty acid transport protein